MYEIPPRNRTDGMKRMENAKTEHSEGGGMPPVFYAQEMRKCIAWM